MNKLLSLVVSLALLPGAVFAASTPDCVKVNKAQIEALFDKWNESLKTGNAQTVSENYLSDAVLLPTVSNKARLTDAERVDYFEHFLAKKPTGKIDMRTIRLGCNKAIDNLPTHLPSRTNQRFQPATHSLMHGTVKSGKFPHTTLQRCLKGKKLCRGRNIHRSLKTSQ